MRVGGTRGRLCPLGTPGHHAGDPDAGRRDSSLHGAQGRSSDSVIWWLKRCSHESHTRRDGSRCRRGERWRRASDADPVGSLIETIQRGPELVDPVIALEGKKAVDARETQSSTTNSSLLTTTPYSRSRCSYSRDRITRRRQVCSSSWSSSSHPDTLPGECLCTSIPPMLRSGASSA